MKPVCLSNGNYVYYASPSVAGGLLTFFACLVTLLQITGQLTKMSREGLVKFLNSLALSDQEMQVFVYNYDRSLVDRVLEECKRRLDEMSAQQISTLMFSLQHLRQVVMDHGLMDALCAESYGWQGRTLIAWSR